MGKRKQSIWTALGVRNKRVYTLTTSQYIVGFVVSITFSMLLTPLFDRYGPRYLEAAAYAVHAIKSLQQESPAAAVAVSSQPRRVEPFRSIRIETFDSLRLRVEQLSSEKRAKTNKLPS